MSSEVIHESMVFENRILEMVTDDSLINVPVDSRIDISAITEDDDNPMFVNIEVVRACVSGNKRRYSNPVIREICALTPGTQGFLGHPDPAKYGFEFRDPQCIYVGSMVDVLPDNSERCISKCYVFKNSPLREWVPKSIAAGNPMTVSINAVADIIRNDDVIDVIHVNELQSIDWANPGTEGVCTSKAMSVVSEQKSNINGGNNMDDSREIIKNATVAELRAYNPSGVENLLKSVTVAELQNVNPDIISEIKKSAAVTEMKLAINGEEKMVKLTEMQGVINAHEDKISELNNTIMSMKVAELKAKKLVELVPEQYRSKIEARISGTTEAEITECINNEIAYIREMGGLDNVPGGKNTHAPSSDDIKSQVAKLFGHKE